LRPEGVQGEFAGSRGVLIASAKAMTRHMLCALVLLGAASSAQGNKTVCCSEFVLRNQQSRGCNPARCGRDRDSCKH